MRTKSRNRAIFVALLKSSFRDQKSGRETLNGRGRTLGSILDATPAGVGMLFRHGIGAKGVGETLLRCLTAHRTMRP